MALFQQELWLQLYVTRMWKGLDTVDTSLNALWPVCCQNNYLSVCLKHGHRRVGSTSHPSAGRTNKQYWRKSEVVMDRFLHLRAEWSSKNSSALLTLGQGRFREISWLEWKVHCACNKIHVVENWPCEHWLMRWKFWCLSALWGGWQEW